MNVNGVTSATNAYAAYNSTAKKVEPKKDETKEAAVYEKSDTKSLSKADREALITKLKADQQSKIETMQNLVSKMFEQQGIKIATADDMWKRLASGDFTADADTIAKAKEDIAEDGYWGVKQTSERIFDFAKALAGDDVEKLKDMQKAFEKGFKEATKTWGRDLPDISNQTKDAVNKLFDDYYASLEN